MEGLRAKAQGGEDSDNGFQQDTIPKSFVAESQCLSVKSQRFSAFSS